MSDVASFITQLIDTSLASTKRAAVLVIDDISMTPKVTAGFPPEREGPIFRKCFIASLRTKVLIMVPIGLLLNAVAPNAITPLLGLGGMYLAYEGTEGVLKKFGYEPPEDDDEVADEELSLEEREEERVENVIKTDTVLSAEIMAVSLSALPKVSLAIQALSLVITALIITLLIFGSGYLIVRSDDYGAWLRDHAKSKFGRSVGQFILDNVPKFLTVLSWVGSFAMLWVAGQLMLEALEVFEINHVFNAIRAFGLKVAANAPFANEFLGELTIIIGEAIFGFIVGLLLLFIVHRIIKPLWNAIKGETTEDSIE